MKGITKTIFKIMNEMVRTTGIAFSRRSLYEKEILMEYGYLPWEVNRTLKRIEKQGYIKIQHNKVKVTERGITHLKVHEASELIFRPTDDPWDGTWRILIFDIPETRRFIRDILRTKIKEWNFLQLQRSVFVTPYDCEKILKELFEILEIRHHAHIITTQKIGDLTKMLKDHYRLT